MIAAPTWALEICDVTPSLGRIIHNFSGRSAVIVVTSRIA